MKAKLLAAGLAVALGAGYSLSALSQVKPEVLVKQRQSAMVLQGKYFGPLAGMAQGKVPYNADIVARNAGFLDALSRMPWDGFDASTTGEKSRALPAIWSDAAGFKTAQDRMQGAIGALAAAARSGNEGNVKAAIADVGKTCGGCHDNFRAK